MSQVARQRRRRAVGARAFSLIELLAVMAVLTLLAGMLLGVGQVVWTRQRQHDAVKLIERTLGVLEDYRDNFGGWPSEVSESKSATNTTTLNAANNAAAKLLIDADGEGKRIEYDGSDPYIVDVYGERLRIVSGGHNRPGLDIWSCGPNRSSDYNADDRRDYGDDIVKWARR